MFWSSWLCFLFSPPWFEVHDHISGPNLSKEFNKPNVLENNVCQFVLYTIEMDEFDIVTCAGEITI